MSKYKVPPADKVYPPAIKKSLGVFFSAAVPFLFLLIDQEKYNDSIEIVVNGGLIFVSSLIMSSYFFNFYKYINIIRYSFDGKEEPESIAHFERLINFFYKATVCIILGPLLVVLFFPEQRLYFVLYPFLVILVLLGLYSAIIKSEFERHGSSHSFNLVENITGKNLMSNKLL